MIQSLTGGDGELAASASLPPLCPPQGCRIYLCGTKSDLLEEDRRKRGVDFHDVQDYADGTGQRVLGGAPCAVGHRLRQGPAPGHGMS